MNQILEINNLFKHYPGFSLQDISVSLESGYIMGFIHHQAAIMLVSLSISLNIYRTKIFKQKGFNREL